MNIRLAILAAADSIEQYPSLFKFSSVVKPDIGCGTPGCVLGWIGLHLGLAYPWYYDEVQAGFYKLLNIDKRLHEFKKDAVFYDRMAEFGLDWRHDADNCVEALRLYADKYHPVTTVIPQQVLDYFKPKNSLEYV